MQTRTAIVTLPCGPRSNHPRGRPIRITRLQAQVLVRGGKEHGTGFCCDLKRRRISVAMPSLDCRCNAPTLVWLFGEQAWRASWRGHQSRRHGRCARRSWRTIGDAGRPSPTFNPRPACSPRWKGFTFPCSSSSWKARVRLCSLLVGAGAEAIADLHRATAAVRIGGSFAVVVLLRMTNRSPTATTSERR